MDPVSVALLGLAAWGWGRLNSDIEAAQREARRRADASLRAHRVERVPPLPPPGEPPGGAS